LRFVRSQVEIELNSATDNPIFLLTDPSPNKAFSAGLFHGEPIGLAADHLRLVLCELAAISERRIYRLATGTLSARLPPLLVQKDRPGLGLLAPQTTAAALVAECRSLGWPAGSDSIPTCEDQEDMVAMSTTAARRAWQVLHSARRVIAIEMMSAAKGLRWRLENEPGSVLGIGTAAAYECVVAGLSDDMTPSKRIQTVEAILASGDVLQAVVTAGVPLEVS
jgi:histidine ammonia-lyase